MPTPMLRRPVQLPLQIAAARPAADERAPVRLADRRCPVCDGPMSCVGRLCACVICGYGTRPAVRKRRRAWRTRRRP